MAEYQQALADKANARAAAILRERKAGRTYTSIAKELGITPTRVRQLAMKAENADLTYPRKARE